MNSLYRSPPSSILNSNSSGTTCWNSSSRGSTSQSFLHRVSVEYTLCSTVGSAVSTHNLRLLSRSSIHLQLPPCWNLLNVKYLDLHFIYSDSYDPFIV